MYFQVVIVLPTALKHLGVERNLGAYMSLLEV
jgi:hypothetical protein